MSHAIHLIDDSYNLFMRAPKIAHNYDPFDKQEDGTVASKKMCDDFGLTYCSKGPALWMYVKKHVVPHMDGWGSCLVHLYRGEGTLYVLKRGKLYEQYMKAGSVVVFNDKCKHFWMSTRPCTILVCNFTESYLDYYGFRKV